MNGGPEPGPARRRRVRGYPAGGPTPDLLAVPPDAVLSDAALTALGSTQDDPPAVSTPDSDLAVGSTEDDRAEPEPDAEAGGPSVARRAGWLDRLRRRP